MGPSPREPEALRHLLEADGGCFRPCGRRSGAPFRKDIVTGVGAKQILARRPVRYPRSSCSSRRGRKRGARSSSNDPAGRGILASPYRTHSTDASSAGRGAEAWFGVVNSAAGVGSRGGTVESPWAFVPATQASRAGIEDFQSRVLYFGASAQVPYRSVSRSLTAMRVGSGPRRTRTMAPLSTSCCRGCDERGAESRVVPVEALLRAATADYFGCLRPAS